MGLAVGGKGHKDHILPTGLGDLAAGRNTPGIGKQNDLQQQCRVIGRGTGMVVAITGCEQRQVEVMIDHMAEGIFEGPGLDLIRKPQRNHLGLVVIVVFVACHPLHPLR